MADYNEDGGNSAPSDPIAPLKDAFGNLTTSVGTDDTLGQSEYDFTQRIFPSDLGSEGSFYGHYLVININVQNNSNMDILRRSGIATQNFTRFSGAELSKTDALRFNIDNQFSNSGGVLGSKQIGVGNNGGLGALLDSDAYLGARPRYTKRIKESIALYMPNSELTFTDAHDYENISLSKFTAGAIGAAATTIATAGVGIGTALTGGASGLAGGTDAINLIKDGAGNLIGALGSISQIFGAPINPKIELLYSNTYQREFALDFLLSPSSEEESKTAEQIIRTLRFHAAPEARGAGIPSFFWIPPSEFDITFYNRGKENTSIPRINTCLLKQIDVSYAPTGTYSTFTNGYPVQIRLMLRFQETEVAHKLRISQGF